MSFITEDMFRVGVISSTHGLKGEVKVFPTTDEPDRFSYLKEVILVTNKEKLDLEVEKARFFKNLVIVKFKDIDDINDIEKYKGAELYVTRENAIPLAEEEYYISDLIGCLVLDNEGKRVGTLSDVITTGANDVYVVDTLDSELEAYKKEKEILIPYVYEYIESIDINKKEIYAKNVSRLF